MEMLIVRTSNRMKRKVINFRKSHNERVMISNCHE